MDIDLLKSTPEEQIEMMLMMQMDKNPEFSSAYTQMPMMEISPPTSNKNNNYVYNSPTISFAHPIDHPEISAMNFATQTDKRNSMAAMREMIFRIAAMQPIHIEPESVKPPKRRNMKISKDPQSVAARHRRERISERIRILQRLVPGGTKMDTASMLDEAIHYVKFLKNQIQSLERAAAANRPAGNGFPVPMSTGNYLAMATKGYQAAQNVQYYADA